MSAISAPTTPTRPIALPSDAGVGGDVIVGAWASAQAGAASSVDAASPSPRPFNRLSIMAVTSRALEQHRLCHRRVVAMQRQLPLPNEVLPGNPVVGHVRTARRIGLLYRWSL